jgi:alpha-L-rhamnosidase
MLMSGKSDLWDSGKIASDGSSHVIYEGKELHSRDRCFWKIRSWDDNGLGSDWSNPSYWEMALLNPGDWQAKWIGNPLFDQDEKTYTGPASKPVASARAYVTGLGFYELYLNGEKVGDQFLSPNQTNYDRRDLDCLLYPFDDKTSQRVSYLTYDVARYLRPGKNVAGLILGHGWYNQRDRLAEGNMWYGLPRFIAQVEMNHSDQTRQSLVSDETWRASTCGPILHNGIFTGERYDARLEMDGWSSGDYEDIAWLSAKLMPPPTGRLVAQYSLPDRVVETLESISAIQVRDGMTRFDFGQNLAGWVRLKVQGPRGKSLPMQFVEYNAHSYGQSDSYVLKGEGVEVYEPRFTWHGFRYAEVIANSDLLAQATLEARVVHTDVKGAGTFKCSNNLFNQILHNCIWSQLSNMHCGVPSDCPHRERVGYTGDWGQICAEAAMFNFDMARFYTKWIDDVSDAQNSETGFVPHSAPFEGGGGGPPWGSAYVTLPWLMYVHYGDRRVMEQHYTGMKRWVEYLKSRTDQDGIIVREEPGSWDLGEWATPTRIEIPPPLVNTCYYAYVAQLMAKSARLLRRTEDIPYFTNLANAAGAAVNRRFLDEARGQYWEGRQGANVFPLAFGLVPLEHRKAVFDRMVEIIVNDNHSHFDTGIFATPLVLDLLTSGGKGDVAYAMMNQHTLPSFGWQLARGATTLWENWNGEGSHNHAMFGSVCQWFYRSLAGINPDPDQPGFKHVVIRPHPLGDLTYAEAKYLSAYGEISSSWRRDADGFHLSLEIPANCSATVLLPGSDQSKIYESGSPVAKAPEVRFLGLREGRVACDIGSGRYEFRVA